jgi:hypothetical protein
VAPAGEIGGSAVGCPNAGAVSHSDARSRPRVVQADAVRALPLCRNSTWRREDGL